MIDYYETKSQPITRVMVWQAYRKVKANHGSAGIDRMDWVYLDEHLKPELYKLWNRLTSGSYFPLPVKQVSIAKKDGGVRQLGIPTILDRIAQQVIRDHLEKIVEPQFHNSSYGYRPRRSCHEAVSAAQRNTFNHDFAIDLDIKGFFDTIDHDLWYADDIVVHCKTAKQAHFMLREITKRMTACKLRLHPDKTQIVNVRGQSEKMYPKGYDFLGFTIRPSMQKFKEKLKVVPSTFVSMKSRKSILQKFESMEIHKRRKPLEVIAKEINPVIRGIINYYHEFGNKQMRYVWNQLNHRLLKWVKWEKGLYKMAAVRWLRQQYKSNTKLFAHWELVHP